MKESQGVIEFSLNKEFTNICYDSISLGHKVQTEHDFQLFCDYFFSKSGCI